MAFLGPGAVNHWRDDECAKAFWRQDEVAAYRDLYADTTAWLDPQAGERWLDLGCGAGRLSRAVWELAGGAVGEVVGVDCATVNAWAFEKLRSDLTPLPGGKVRFQQVDFSAGLPWPGDALFDGVVSGLAIQYAEHLCPTERKWTTEGYDRLLREVNRVLKPGGRFVFSVNVPEPNWAKVARHTLRCSWWTAWKPRTLRRMWRLYRYGGWLTREAQAGRFHYLPADDVGRRLAVAGFEGVEYRTSFAGQAFVFRCRKASAVARVA